MGRQMTEENTPKICDICGKSDPFYVSTDCCNKTHKVRGVLCIDCSSILIMADSSQEILRKAVAYLEEHS